jgi:hypothetical protein
VSLLPQLLIDEHIRIDGAVVRTHLGYEGGRITVTSDDGIRGALSAGAIAKVMERYGRPLDLAVAPLPPEAEAPRLALGATGALLMLRFKARVDADVRDYLVWERDGAEPLAALSNGVAAALRYLCLQLAEQRGE